MKIVAMVGTNPYSFERMVRPLNDLVRRNGWTAFVQLGNTPYEPPDCEFGRFVDRQLLMQHIREADIVVTHGGFGSINDALACGKPIVAVPRSPDLGESQDRQEELVREMERNGHLIGVYDIAGLEAAIERAREFRPARLPPSSIPEIIRQYLVDQGLL